MIRSIVKDTTFLSKKSKPATKKDLSIGKDLLDTLQAHSSHCVGMAANMIGEQKNIIVVQTEWMPIVMYNPHILTKAESYVTQEGCLCHSGQKSVKRYEKITVQYRDGAFQKQTRTFSGLTAQIIQHEIDHCLGVLI